jgi:CheY-like chemotaxis protein
VVNARDAMPMGGTLTIEVSKHYLDDLYCQNHIDIKPGNYVMIAISDTGVGMDSAVLSRIFEPFFTTKERDKGTGLGLSTVEGIVSQSDGYIHVYSESGIGTTFKIYLPESQESMEKCSSERRFTQCIQGSETVMIVEDEDLVRRVVKRILEAYGYHVLEAGNGKKALSICKEYQEKIDILFTDVVMPGMTGKDLVENWIQMRPETKILFTSGYTENVIIHQGNLEAGINFIQKPYRPEFLATKIREVLDSQISSAN